MSSINVQQLLEPLSLDEPCGENLEYDSLTMELEQAAKPKPEQEIGGTIVPAEEPDWREVQRIALELLKRTKDLRVLAHLSRAVLRLQGLEAFRDCLAVFQGYLKDYWEDVHPRLDPDDDNDPVFRVNTISSLADRTATLDLIERAEVVAAQGIGKFTFRDLLVAEGERQPAEDEEPPERGHIEAAFMGCDVDELKARADAVSESVALAGSIESDLTERVGAAQACSLDDLQDKLLEVSRALAAGLSKRGVGTEEDETAVEGEEGGATGGGGGAAGAPAGSISGAVNNRRDVINALEKVCDYYDTHEPSSPIPLLLKGAKRLASMSFLEIVNDVTPEGLQQLKSIAGITDEDS